MLLNNVKLSNVTDVTSIQQSSLGSKIDIDVNLFSLFLFFFNFYNVWKKDFEFDDIFSQLAPQHYLKLPNINSISTFYKQWNSWIIGILIKNPRGCVIFSRRAEVFVLILMLQCCRGRCMLQCWWHLVMDNTCPGWDTWHVWWHRPWIMTHVQWGTPVRHKT